MINREQCHECGEYGRVIVCDWCGKRNRLSPDRYSSQLPEGWFKLDHLDCCSRRCRKELKENAVS